MKSIALHKQSRQPLIEPDDYVHFAAQHTFRNPVAVWGMLELLKIAHEGTYQEQIAELSSRAAELKDEAASSASA